MKIPYQWLGAVFISIFAVIVIPSMAVGQVSNYDFGFGEDSIFAPSFSVDLKINGSNGPVEVSAGERVVVSWLTEGAAKCRSNFSSRDMTMRNTVAGRVTRSVTVRFACINDARERLDDFVLVNVRGTAPAVVPTLPPQAITDTPPVSAQPSITAPTTSTNTSIPADQTAGFVPDLFKISPCPALGNFGDVTDDKKITKKDLDVIRSVILGLSSFSNDAQKKNADVNGDGKVDTLDIQFIRRYLINADTSFPVCASDAGSIPPLVTTTTISECGTIQKGGTYSIVSDLSSPSGSCIQVKDTTDVTIACDGKKTVSSVEFSNIQRFSLKNCILSGPKNNPLTILNSTDGEISGNTLTHGWVHVEGTKNLIVRDNTFSSTLYQQYHTDNTLIERNIFTFDSTKAHSPSVVANISLNNGTNNRILGNTTDGGSNGIFNNLGTPGADDSIVLYNQTGAIVENNTLQNVWDCAIENSGTLERSFIKNNTIKNVGYCGIGGWYWSNWKNNTVSGNTVEDAPRLFQFGRDYGIRSGENGVYFSDNIFERNTFLKPRLSGIFTSGADSGSSSFSIQKFLAISTSGLTDDERLPSGNEFFLSNNRFTANDFSTSRSAPTFSIGVVDGGGNICGTTPSGYPLKCGTVSVNVQTNAPTTSTYTSVADLPDSFEKPLVCGQKGDINNDGRITKADHDLIPQINLGLLRSALPAITDEEAAAAVAAANVNGLDGVTSLDGTLIARYLLGLTPSFTGCVFVPKPIPTSCGSKGDVTLDGKIDNADVIIVRKQILGKFQLESGPLANADVNGDGKVATLDITFMRRYLLGLDSTFAGCAAASAQPSTYTSVADLPDSFEKPLVCGQKGDINNDGRITKADHDLIPQINLGLLRSALPAITDEEAAAAVAAANVNGLDGVTSLDGTLIARYLLGLTPSFTGCVFVPKPIPTSCGSKGDVTLDGKIDNADVIIVRKQILGKFQLESGPLANADVNGKDGVTTLDITFLRRYLLGLDATFPGCTTTSAQPSITVVSPNGGETWKIGEQRTVQLTVSGAPTSSYLQVSLVNGPTPIDIRAFTGPSGTISFDYSLPTTGCFTDYCHNLTPGEYKVQAVLYDKQPCNMRFPCTAEKFITSDLSNVPFTITATVSAPTQPVVTTTSSTTVGKPLICGSLGDVNNDGFVTADDKELTRTFILGTATPTDAQKVAADVNKSDSITSLDLTFIQRYVDGLSATLPGCPVAN